jgi:hypothetical protein
MIAPNQASTSKIIYVSRTGLPLKIQLEWPFRHATSGADFDVLHTVITLENSEGLCALVAVNLSATLRQVLPSLEPRDTEGPIINALRKEVDTKQTEFVKSGKLVPLPFSSRHYSFKQGKWTFGKADDEELARMIERKVYWQTRLAGGDVWLDDPTEAQYVDTTGDHIAESAAGIAERGLFVLKGGYASALPLLMAQGDRFEAEMAAALRQLDEKHAFERG